MTPTAPLSLSHSLVGLPHKRSSCHRHKHTPAALYHQSMKVQSPQEALVRKGSNRSTFPFPYSAFQHNQMELYFGVHPCSFLTLCAFVHTFSRIPMSFFTFSLPNFTYLTQRLVISSRKPCLTLFTHSLPLEKSQDRWAECCWPHVTALYHRVLHITH